MSGPKTIQGEVHDEECYYTMEGISGHAGLFANATDLAKLASVMISGGYGNNAYFTKNTRDLSIAPQVGGQPNYGIGWWREADDKRVWYFGTQSPESTIGHQGWTGTLSMIDFENNMVVVFLTNSINTPIFEPTCIENANQFTGQYYTSSTLGFVMQILYTGINNSESPDKALESLIKDMVNEKCKIIDKAEEDFGKTLSEDHPLKLALKALCEASE
ncbi:serine hydrolase [Butyrivibrio sp. AE3004]|uniref:serine hydrolase n=1 Tax=Butyrivibrio sp. AE3004 TaxID=1506994 RepID=UPI000A6DB451|nr:serine hydrolase [Butyrivibrio sp. AE3004]